jgi:hypothetical protein
LRIACEQVQQTAAHTRALAALALWGTPMSYELGIQIFGFGFASSKANVFHQRSHA